MVNQLADQMWGAARSLLSLGWQIDKILDWIEKLGSTIVPAQVQMSAQKEARSDALLDQFTA